jgi:hypothetical protein
MELSCLTLENVTVPLGVPAGDVTVAVKVTSWPDLEGLWFEASEISVAVLVTVWVIVGDVLVEELSLPLKTAVSESADPTGNAFVSHVATPLATGRAVQPVIGVPSTLKLTEPASGISVPGATGLIVAVRVTGSVRVVLASLEARSTVVLCLTTWCALGLDVLVR